METHILSTDFGWEICGMDFIVESVSNEAVLRLKIKLKLHYQIVKQVSHTRSLLIQFGKKKPCNKHGISTVTFH